MNTTTNKSMHPLTAIAAVSITLFSLVGIGAITGLIPTSHSQTEQVQLPQVATSPAQTQPVPVQAAASLQEPAKPAAAAQAALAAPANKVSASKPVKQEVAAKHSKPVEYAEPVEQAARPAQEPVMVAKAEIPAVVAQTPPPPNQPAPAIMPVAPICHDCGMIESVREIEKTGAATGGGAALGGIAGGVLGHQTGKGRGKDVMTVLGAIGGAVAGHQIEKNATKVKSYEIVIRFDDGSTRLIGQDNPPAWRAGDKVRLVNGVITANNNY